MYAKIKDYEIPPTTLKFVEIMNGKIIVSGDSVGFEISEHLAKILESMKEGERVNFNVASELYTSQGTGTIMNKKNTHKPFGTDGRMKYSFEIWL